MFGLSSPFRKSTLDCPICIIPMTKAKRTMKIEYYNTRYNITAHTLHCEECGYEIILPGYAKIEQAAEEERQKAFSEDKPDGNAVAEQKDGNPFSGKTPERAVEMQNNGVLPISQEPVIGLKAEQEGNEASKKTEEESVVKNDDNAEPAALSGSILLQEQKEGNGENKSSGIATEMNGKTYTPPQNYGSCQNAEPEECSPFTTLVIPRKETGHPDACDDPESGTSSLGQNVTGQTDREMNLTQSQVHIPESDAESQRRSGNNDALINSKDAVCPAVPRRETSKTGHEKMQQTEELHACSNSNQNQTEPEALPKLNIGKNKSRQNQENSSIPIGDSKEDPGSRIEDELDRKAEHKALEDDNPSGNKVPQKNCIFEKPYGMPMSETAVHNSVSEPDSRFHREEVQALLQVPIRENSKNVTSRVSSKDEKKYGDRSKENKNQSASSQPLQQSPKVQTTQEQGGKFNSRTSPRPAGFNNKGATSGFPGSIPSGFRPINGMSGTTFQTLASLQATVKERNGKQMDKENEKEKRGSNPEIKKSPADGNKSNKKSLSAKKEMESNQGDYISPQNGIVQKETNAIVNSPKPGTVADNKKDDADNSGGAKNAAPDSSKHGYTYPGREENHADSNDLSQKNTTILKPGIKKNEKQGSRENTNSGSQDNPEEKRIEEAPVPGSEGIKTDSTESKSEDEPDNESGAGKASPDMEPTDEKPQKATQDAENDIKKQASDLTQIFAEKLPSKVVDHIPVLSQASNKAKHSLFVNEEKKFLETYVPHKKVIISDLIYDTDESEMFLKMKGSYGFDRPCMHYNYRTKNGNFFRCTVKFKQEDTIRVLDLIEVKRLLENYPDLYKKFFPDAVSEA